MAIGFIVMQIGNEQLDAVCGQAIVPAIEACDLEAKRVDKHNEGGLLKSEIINFIESADVVVADLTNARPNVYLEIGYTMGIDKFRNLILTVREDHFPDSPNFVQGGPKIHFDLAGYDVLAWEDGKLDEFRAELQKRIRRRLALVAPPAVTPPPILDAEWIESQRSTANAGLAEAERSGFMEAVAALHPPKINHTQAVLNDAARASPIDTFGWPIGVYLTRDDARPRPRADGVSASIHGQFDGNQYDYWSIRRNGDFYTCMSLFEDKRTENAIFFNTRIVRVTELILYLIRLYTHLGVDPTAHVTLRVRHGGLEGRVLGASSANRSLHHEYRSEEQEVETTIEATLEELENDLVAKVRELLAPLFVLFEFFELADPVFDDIVSKFVAGEVT